MENLPNKNRIIYRGVVRATHIIAGLELPPELTMGGWFTSFLWGLFVQLGVAVQTAWRLPWHFWAGKVFMYSIWAARH